MSSSEQFEVTPAIGSGVATEEQGFATRVIHDPSVSGIVGVVATGTAFGFLITGMWSIGLVV